MIATSYHRFLILFCSILLSNLSPSASFSIAFNSVPFVGRLTKSNSGGANLAIIDSDEASSREEESLRAFNQRCQEFVNEQRQDLYYSTVLECSQIDRSLPGV